MKEVCRLSVEEMIISIHGMIDDLYNICGYSYARIATRIFVSPSTIQKCRQYRHRCLRSKSFYNLILLYCRIFFGEYRLEHISEIVRKDEKHFISRLPEAFRGRIDELSKAEARNLKIIFVLVENGVVVC